MTEITWEWLAGFFDGEGSISVTLGKHYGICARISVTQSGDRGHDVIEGIAAFLLLQGIFPSKIGVRSPENNPLSKLPQYTLAISSRESVDLFLYKIFPYLKLKNLEAQHAWRTLKIYPKVPHGGRLAWESRDAKLTKDQILNIKSRYVRGLNASDRSNSLELATEYGVEVGTIRRIGNGRSWAYVIPATPNPPADK
jgi:hypothetical protein